MRVLLVLFRLLRLSLVLPAFACFGCTDLPSLPERSGVANPPDVLSVTASPPRDDGKTSRVSRFTIELGHAFPADALRTGRLALVTGGADAAEVAAIASAHTTAALRSRYAEVVTWGEPVGAPLRFHIQPTAPLPKGRATMVMLIDKKPPLVVDLDVADEPEPLRRVWPLEGQSLGELDAWTYCARSKEELEIALLDMPEVVSLAPMDATAHVIPRSEAPCFDLSPDVPLRKGTALPPPAIGTLAIDPSPVTIGERAPAAAHLPCGEGELSLGPACGRIDDDRIVLIGNDVAPLLVLGRVGDQKVVVALSAHARAVVRGFTPSTSLDVAITLRDAEGESAVETSLRTLPRHRHLVINEVLSRAPSGSPSQRFVELFNDGDQAADLSDLWLGDGDDFYELPDETLAAGAFLLITPGDYVDGLGGDAPPIKATARFLVESLRLSADLSLVDDEDQALSRFPGTTSTRAVSRGRRTPDRPDDAPDAFGFDAHAKATPGAPNVIGE